MLAEAYARVSARKWTDAFVLPVDGKPTSNFGTRSYYNGQQRAPHAGVDFVGEPGTPIRAANHGEVVVAAPMYFTGNTVVVDYGDRLFSVFAHLSELHVKAGDTVEPTTIVGLVGATGRVTGPHLHWSVRLNGARVDPLSLVAATSGAPLNGNRCIWCRFFFRCTTTKAMRSTRTTTSSCGLSSPIASAASPPTCERPARGVWKGDTGETTRDDIVIFEVMCEDLDREWWTGFRKDLERRFRQESLIVRALTSTLL